MASKNLERLYNTREISAYKRGAKLPLVACSVPNGRTSYTIYAVALSEHQGIVKVGQTSRWKSRLSNYQNWNLANGDAVERYTRFAFYDAFVDLRQLEAHVLESVRREFPVYRGSEWFSGDYDEVVRLIDRTIAATGLSYDIE